MTATNRNNGDTTATDNTMTGDRWLTRAEVAARYQLPVGTLADWAIASKRTGPPYSKFGKHVRYKLADLLEWERQLSDSQASATESLQD